MAALSTFHRERFARAIQAIGGWKPRRRRELQSQLLIQAQALLEAGISFVSADRLTGMPCSRRALDPETGEVRLRILPWQEFEYRQPTVDEALAWFGSSGVDTNDAPDAIAVIGGSVSGGLECLRFDCHLHVFDEWMCELKAREPTLPEKLVILSAPKGCREVIYRYPDLDQDGQVLAEHWICLATDPEKFYRGQLVARAKRFKDGVEYATFVAIETRGKNATLLTAPSRGYRELQGVVADAPVVSRGERDMMHACARDLCHARQHRRTSGG